MSFIQLCKGRDDKPMQSMLLLGIGNNSSQTFMGKGGQVQVRVFFFSFFSFFIVTSASDNSIEGAEDLPCGSEIFNLGCWHPLQRVLKTYLAEAKCLLSGVGIPYKGC